LNFPKLLLPLTPELVPVKASSSSRSAPVLGASMAAKPAVVILIGGCAEVEDPDW